MMYELVLNGVLQGLVLALVAFGVMIPFRLLKFPDLTAEGTYPLGGAVCAGLLLLDLSPTVAILGGGIVAGFAGIATAFIHLRLKINTLLAGIIVSTMLYSINLRLMGKPNIALFEHDLIFVNDDSLLRSGMILAILALMVLPIFVFLRTELGLRFRAVGLNPGFAIKQGIPVGRYTLLGLLIGHMYIGVAGSLMVQLQSYADISMGVGMVIHALAALMIGESIVGNATLGKQLVAPLIGALCYQQIQGVALFIGLAPTDLKLLTGAIVLGVIALRGSKL